METFQNQTTNCKNHPSRASSNPVFPLQKSPSVVEVLSGAVASTIQPQKPQLMNRARKCVQHTVQLAGDTVAASFFRPHTCCGGYQWSVVRVQVHLKKSIYYAAVDDALMVHRGSYSIASRQLQNVLACAHSQTRVQETQLRTKIHQQIANTSIC